MTRKSTSGIASLTGTDKIYCKDCRWWNDSQMCIHGQEPSIHHHPILGPQENYEAIMCMSKNGKCDCSDYDKHEWMKDKEA